MASVCLAPLCMASVRGLWRGDGTRSLAVVADRAAEHRAELDGHRHAWYVTNRVPVTPEEIQEAL